MRFRKILIALIFIIISSVCGVNSSSSSQQSENIKILSSMTLEQKVGQLFLIRPECLYTEISPDELVLMSNDIRLTHVTDEMRETLKKYPVGGFILYGKNKGQNKNIINPEQLKIFTNDLKAACEITPIIAVDEEGGRVARLANHGSFDVTKYESMLAIGDTGDVQNAYNAAKTIGGYIKEYGFNMNFAPVADVNSNPDNPIIGSRSFGSNPEIVSKMVSAYLDGLHAENIAGSIKHFPGHGDTKTDTHKDVTYVYKTWDELKELELIPFKENLDNADSVMVAHITMPNVISDEIPVTLSKEIITEKLRGELGYDGVIITDALYMGAVTKVYSDDKLAVMAFDAGNDILLRPYDYKTSFNAVLNAVKSGQISEQRLNESVLRILNLKSKYNLINKK